MAVMTTTDYYKLVEPSNITLCESTYKQYPAQYKDVFEVVEGEEAAYQEDVILAEYGYVPVLTEGAARQSDKSGIARVQRYETIEFGLGAAITRKARDDNRHLSISKLISKEFGKSLAQTKNLQHTGFLNQGFSSDQLLADNQPLFSLTHGGYDGLVTGPNMLAVSAQFSQAAVEAILNLIATAVDERGKPVLMKAVSCFVHPLGLINAKKILGTPLNTAVAAGGGDQNLINLINQDNLIPGGVKPLHFLTNPNFWMIKTDAPYGFKSITRTDIESGTHGAWETNNMEFSIYSRFGWGCSNWRAAYASGN